VTRRSVLEGGSLHRSSARAARARRLRRRRRLRLGACLVVLCALVLLAFLATRTSGVATSRHATTVAAGKRSHPATARVQAPVYGRLPDAVQIHPRLQLPLRSGLLFDVRTGRVLWEKDPTQRLPIASLTKMMTALVVVAHSKPTDRVLITKQAVDFTGSGVGMLPLGKRVPEKALLYGLLLPSGNDAAIALAQHVAGTQARFIGLMNRTASAMGLSCTHFATVSGVIDQGNFSCAVDLAVLAHAVLTQPVLAPIVASPSAILPFPIKGGKLFLYNNNPLLVQAYPGTDGVKTGYTTAAGLCIVAAARRGSTWLAVVLLHSGNWGTQAISLLNAGFAAVARSEPHPGPSTAPSTAPSTVKPPALPPTSAPPPSAAA